MSQLDTIVSIVIDVQTDTVARTSFGVPAVMSQFLTSKTTLAFGRSRAYANLAELVADGWATTDSVYLACASIFMQSPRPAAVVVGRRDAADTNWAAALAAIQLENDSWYYFGIVPVSGMDAEVLEAAAWAETQTKIFFAQTGDTDVLTSATDDAASALQDLGYKRTALVYRPAAKATQFTELGWVGEGAPFAPGSSTWAYKSIAGSTPDALTSAQKAAALGKNANVYTTVAGANITQSGKVVAGEWIDVIIGIDALTAELQETLYAAMIANRKLDFEDGGITAVGGLIQGVLEKYGRQGVLQIDSIKLTLPAYEDIPVSDRNTRKLSGITFRALLQGAIHLVEIYGTVSN